VPYVFPVNAFESIGEKVSRRRIEFAMAHYRRHTALRFVERTSQRNYVRFVWGDSCSSWVGAQGGEQVVTLMRQSGNSAGCSVGDIVHELGHAIGFQHEHQRQDRDQHIRVNVGNVKPDARSSYARSVAKIDILEYDYGSIMHYEPRGSLAINRNLDVITPLSGPYEQWKQKWNNGNDVAIGQKDGLSHIDAREVDLLYSKCIDEGVRSSDRKCTSTPTGGYCWRVSEYGDCSTHAPGDSFRPGGRFHTQDTCQATHRYRKVFCVDATTGLCALEGSCSAGGKPAESKECMRGNSHERMSMSDSLTCRFMRDTCYWQNGFYAFPEVMGSDIPFTLMAGNHYEATSPQGGVELSYGADDDHLGYLLFNTKHLSSTKKRGDRAHFVSPPVAAEAGKCLVFNHHIYSGCPTCTPGSLRLEMTTCAVGGSAGPGAWTTLWDSDAAGVRSENQWREVEVPLHDLTEMGVSLMELHALAAQSNAPDSRQLRGMNLAQRPRKLFLAELTKAANTAKNSAEVDWDAGAAQEVVEVQQSTTTGNIWTHAGVSAGPTIAGGPTAASSAPVLRQLRFTATVGSDPSRSDLGLDNFYVQDCSWGTTLAVRNAQLARSSAWSSRP
jgi:hypothetical protein